MRSPTVRRTVTSCAHWRPAGYRHQRDILHEQVYGSGGLAPRMSVVELHIVGHLLDRLDAEIRWHDKLIADVSATASSLADHPVGSPDKDAQS